MQLGADQKARRSCREIGTSTAAARIGGDWVTPSDCYSSAIVWSPWIVGPTADAQTVVSGPPDHFKAEAGG